jgi:enamine deaminase RidA (YjgF/YER057c/UK114 family)
MTIQRFDTGPRMSQVVVHGDTIYLAGVVAKTTAGESVTRQTQEMNAVWDGWVSARNTPARATVEAGLAAPQYGVEIMVIAAR